MVFRLVPEPKLVGFTTRVKLLPLNWKTWSTGEYQLRCERWLQEQIGFRSAGIRTDSQINYSLFRESAIKTADVPVIGKDCYLYSRIYLDEYNRRKISQLKSPGEYARDLRRLQDGLWKRGKAFVLLIAPSKAEICPEYIPARFLAPSTRGRQSDYQRLLPALQKEGIRMVDGHAVFMEQKVREPWLLFPPGGIHWQEYGAWQILDRLTRELESQMRRPLAKIACEDIPSGGVEWSKGEADLAAVLNTWAQPQWSQHLPRPRFRLKEDADACCPSLLMVGDSFMFGLINLVNHYKTARKMDFYYYYGTLYSYPSGKIEKLDKGRVNWNQDVFARDAVIIEMNEILLDSKAWGFVEDALKHMDDLPESK